MSEWRLDFDAPSKSSGGRGTTKGKGKGAILTIGLIAILIIGVMFALALSSGGHTTASWSVLPAIASSTDYSDIAVYIGLVLAVVVATVILAGHPRGGRRR